MGIGLRVLRLSGFNDAGLMRILFLVYMLFYACITHAAQERIEITLWHAMAAELGQSVKQIAERFNASQDTYRLIPIYKGTYNEVLTSTAAAFRAQKPPHLVQVFEVGTATMIYPEGIIRPIKKLPQNPEKKQRLIVAIKGYYSDEEGQLLGMPFNSSSAVLYYNKDAFQKAGLDANSPPKTWLELKQHAQALLQAGYRCGFTTAYPSWILVEVFSAWHNQPITSHANGFAGLAARAHLDNEILIQHLNTLATWQQQKIFKYGGRDDHAVALFTSGHCPIMLQSSGGFTGLQAQVPFAMGVGALPYWEHIADAPQNTLIGGAALWALQGHPEEDYKGIAEFFDFLLQPDIQLFWQQQTDYLPLTEEALLLGEKQGYYKKHPGARVALDSLNHKSSTEFSRGLRLGNFMQIRDIIDESLESIFAGKQEAAVALKRAEVRVNRLLRRFERNVQAKG